MSSVLKAVSGHSETTVHIKRALLSVSDKTGLIPFATFLTTWGVELISTGGTAKAMRDAGLPVQDVADLTGFPEMMDGRVKTLHPKIHGALLAVRGNPSHERDMITQGITPIDLVVMNLYAFEKAVASHASFDTCIENVDIGGPSMLRSAAKNHRDVTVCTSPSQYDTVMAEMTLTHGATTLTCRRRLASEAFTLSAHYDAAIATWFSQQLRSDSQLPASSNCPVETVPAPIKVTDTDINQSVSRSYHRALALKYGCNPHQLPAAIYTIGNAESSSTGSLPFTVLNGSPGYINLLDALNGMQLVAELRQALNLPAAASFKHVSPAGTALAVPLTPLLTASYEVGNAVLTPLALAYLRARNADPLSSFGDFVAVSDVVDAATARVIKREVSDGIIAPGYEPEALAILKTKKGGKFIILQSDPTYVPPDMEWREVYGVTFSQRRNDVPMSTAHVTNIQTGDAAAMTPARTRDLLLAAITLKYTQSNSVGYALDGQMIGVGAGQQSRVDCVKLAGRKVAVWHLRQHPKVQGLQFASHTKRQDRVNARVRYIEGDMAAPERKEWEALLSEIPSPLTPEEKATFMSELTQVSLASDAFFPFRDSIDVAAKLGVTYVSQPGGSTRDREIMAACEEYGMTMAFSNLRLFHH